MPRSPPAKTDQLPIVDELSATPLADCVGTPLSNLKEASAAETTQESEETHITTAQHRKLSVETRNPAYLVNDDMRLKSSPIHPGSHEEQSVEIMPNGQFTKGPSHIKMVNDGFQDCVALFPDRRL